MPLRVNVTWLSSMDTIASVPPMKLPPPPSHAPGPSSVGLLSPKVPLVLAVRSTTVPACWLSGGRSNGHLPAPAPAALEGTGAGGGVRDRQEERARVRAGRWSC